VVAELLSLLLLLLWGSFNLLPDAEARLSSRTVVSNRTSLSVFVFGVDDDEDCVDIDGKAIGLLPAEAVGPKNVF
jgi:hypothetical protein